MLTKRILTMMTLIVCVAVIAVFSYNALRNPWLWFDESGQFWISKGLNHYSEVYAASGGLSDVIENNRHYNLDPGGFSVLLYFWLLINDSSTLFLRLLPYLFFLGFASVVFLYTYKSSKNILEAAFLTTLLFLWEVTANEMGEVRGYTMEMCGVVGAVYLIRFHSVLLTKRFLLVLGIWLSVFSLSRYDFVVFVIGVSLWIFLGLLHERLSFGKLVARLAYYAVPLIVVLLVVLVVMLMHQNPAGSAESYLYLGSSAHAWLTPLFLFGALNALLVIYDYKKGVVVLPSQSLFLVIFLVYCLLSLLRIFPLDVRGSMALTVVLTIALVERFFLIIPVHSYIKVFVLFCLMQVCRTTPLSELGSTNIDTKTFLEFTELKQNSSYDKLFVDYWMNPDFRYLYEYGALRNEAQKDGYPNRFVLQIDDDDPSKVVMPGEVDCDYYIITRFSKFTKQYDMSPFRPLDDESQDIYQRN